MDLWQSHDYAVQRQIVHSIPNTIFICVQNHTTATTMWEALKKDFEGRTQAVQNELQNWLTLAKCGENENVHEHVDRMWYMLEELSGMGVTIADGKYAAILIKSMPKMYGHYFAAISGVAEVSGNSLMPEMVMNHAVSEYNRRQIENAPRRGATTGDTALYTFVTDSGCSGRRSKRRGKGDEKCTCFNCGEAGHLKRDCQKPKKEGEKAKESRSRSTSQSASTRTSKAPQASASIVEVKEPTPPPRDVYSAATFTGYTREALGAIFDCGCTAHVSPYQDLFTNYTHINSIPITAVNKTYFQAIGRRDIKITLPNGGGDHAYDPMERPPLPWHCIHPHIHVGDGPRRLLVHTKKQLVVSECAEGEPDSHHTDSHHTTRKRAVSDPCAWACRVHCCWGRACCPNR